MGKVRKARKRAALAAHHNTINKSEDFVPVEQEESHVVRKKEKRLEKRANFVEKLTKEAGQQKEAAEQQKKKKKSKMVLNAPSATLAELWSSLDASLADAESVSAKRKAGGGAPVQQKRPQRMRQQTKLVAQEAKNIQKISSHPLFQQNPLAALKSHILHNHTARDEQKKKNLQAERRFAKNKTLRPPSDGEMQ